MLKSRVETLHIHSDYYYYYYYYYYYKCQDLSDAITTVAGGTLHCTIILHNSDALLLSRECSVILVYYAFARTF